MKLYSACKLPGVWVALYKYYLFYPPSNEASSGFLPLFLFLNMQRVWEKKKKGIFFCLLTLTYVLYHLQSNENRFYKYFKYTEIHYKFKEYIQQDCRSVAPENQNSKLWKRYFLFKWMVPVLECYMAKFQKKQKRVSTTVNYITILPDCTGILSIRLYDDDHICWPQASLLSPQFCQTGTIALKTVE